MTDALIELRSGRVERYDVNDIPHLRKNLGGFGYSYLNSRTGLFELARRIEVIPDEVQQRVNALRSASISRKSHRNEVPNQKLPAHLRNHLIYGS